MIQLMRSTFYEEKRTLRRLQKFLGSARQLSLGPQCLAFEKRFAQFQGRQHAVFFNSGSSANLALIQALVNLGRLRRGDLVAFSSLTWATNVMPLTQMGLRVLPVDVSPDHLNVTAQTLRAALRKGKPRALFLTHLLGFCGDLAAIQAVCREKKVLLLEDNCESLGSRYRKKLLGNFGFASTFSTFVGHHLSTIEGGLVLTDDADLHAMLLMVRSHGWDRNLEPARQAPLRRKHGVNPFFARYTFYVPAYNLRPTEINGFLGSEQLPYQKKTIPIRARNFGRFQDALKENPELQSLDLDHMDLVSNFAFPVVVKKGSDFSKYLRRFEGHGVEVRPIVGGSMTEQPFFKALGIRERVANPCPNAKKVHQQGFYFPNRPDLTSKEIDLLCSLLRPQ